MNWLKSLFNHWASAQRFNPWHVLVCPECPVNGADAEGETAPTRATQPAPVPYPLFATQPAQPPTITETAHEPPPSTPDDGNPDQTALGIGACVILPWRFHRMEKK